MHISPTGLRLIEQFEGLRLTRYLDSVGVPTIGFGTTASVVNPVPETCTVAQAEAWLRIYVERECEPAINATGARLNPNQFDALCSLAYNCGAGIVGGGFQIGRDLRSGNMSAASADFMHYVFAGGRVLQGLVNRRQAEQLLFRRLWVDPEQLDPHHYLWFDHTPRALGNGRGGSERAVVTEYDHERVYWLHFPRRLHRLRQDAMILAGRLESVMETDAAHNVAEHRQWRHDQLRGRSEGRRYV